MDPSRRRRALATVFGVVFLDLLGFSIVIPILPYYTRAFFPGPGNEVVIGALAASYSVMQFLFAPLLGSLSDRYGRRPVLLVSIAGSVLAWTVFGLASALWMLFVSRMLAGAMGGNISTAQAYVADVTPVEERAQALGLLGAAFGLGFVFGPAIGAVLSFPEVVGAVDGVVDGVAITRYSLPAFAAAAASLVALLVGSVALPESRDLGTATERRSQVAQLRDAVANDAVRDLLVAFFLLSFAFAGVQTMFIPYVADVYGYSESQASLLLTYIGVLAVVVQGGLIGPLTRRFDAVRLTAAGTGLLAVALGAIPFARELSVLFPDLTGVAGFLTPALFALLFVLALLSLGNGVVNVTLAALVSTRASADRQGSAFGLTQGAGSLARAVGPVVMGGAYAAVGFRAPFVFGAVLVVPVLLIAARLKRPADAAPAEEQPTDPGHVR
ncbi:MFS transporter [Halorarius halobius]|uniref:MFS transporter n=1 Tax=Halorarius halobius TaxID=2962671 RepID=UPI0020CD5F82|nr:MFS transporter [Halorarius halobius]